MKHQFIDANRSRHDVAALCQALQVSRSGYYAARSRSPSAHSERQQMLTSQIRAIHVASRDTYGAPRIHAELAAQGLRCCVGVQMDRPNACWVSDITYSPTREGWLYLAGVLDLYSRAVVGWAMSKTLDTQLATDALNMAIRRRGVGPTIVHSDQGSTYATAEYRTLLSRHGIRQSMRRKGDCWDVNAGMESFFSTLKTERVSRRQYATREQARTDIFDYIERGSTILNDDTQLSAKSAQPSSSDVN